MRIIDLKKFWESNAEAWTFLTRRGYDVYRDHINTPAFLRMLPNVKGLRGLDVGCGEGHNTRRIAEKGAFMTGIDISEKFVFYARQREKENPLEINYLQGIGRNIPFKDEIFDFYVATMSLMDMPDHEMVISEIHRTLRDGGFFQFSISHPCFFTPRFGWMRDDRGEKIALMCGDYFEAMKGEVEEWIFSAAPDDLKKRFEKFKIPRFTRTLSSWLNLLVNEGFILEAFDEPYPDEETIERIPHLKDAKIVAYFLIVRCRKRST